MPNVKLFVDADLWADRKAELIGCAEPLRTLLCRELCVPIDACQMAFIPSAGLAGQPTVNVEVAMLRGAGRTRQRIEQLALQVRAMIEAAGGGRTAVRCLQLDPESYVTLK